MTYMRSLAARGQLALLAASLAVAACHKPIDPILPAGESGYEAVVVDPATATPARYSLKPGDKIAVRVYGESELSVSEVIIDNAGIVSLPLIGDVRAIDHTATELATEIEAAYAARFLRNPRVAVFILKGLQQTIAVEGEVRQPGVFPFEEGQTLLSAMALAGSPGETAKLDEVMIFRTIDGQKTAGRFDLRLIRGGRMPDVELVPGDVIVVGYSAARSAFLDVVRVLPVLGYFRPIN